MRALLLSTFFIIFFSPAWGQIDPEQMPGYLVFREGSASQPLKFDKRKIYFEWENNDYAYASDWPAEGAFLIIQTDENKIGILGEENLFGDMKEGYSKEIGFKDGNNDGFINSEDMVWSSLGLWFDKNSDGYPQSDELRKLSEDTRASFDRNKGELSFLDKLYSAHAFLPYYDQVNSRYVGNYTLDIETLFLPTLRGYATIPDLHIAASKNASLKESLIKVCSKPPKEVFSGQYMKRLEGDFGDVMYKWAGVDQIDPKSRGPFIDARQLAILEIIQGKKFSGYKYQTGPEQTPDPNTNAAKTLKKAYNLMASRAYSFVLAQCVGRQLFVPPLKYDFSKDAVELTPKLATLQTRANIDNLLASMTDFEKQSFWFAFEDFLTSIDPINPTASQELIKAFKGPPSMLKEKPRPETKSQ